jgi:Na+/H+-dicarboxylate symporter
MKYLFRLPLYAKILLAMALGLVWGFTAEPLGLLAFTANWIKPWGTLFINSLKLIAIPLIVFSLVDGIAGLSDVSKLSRMGGRTIALYLFTTVMAVTIGLLTVNLVQPGKFLSAGKRQELSQAYAADIDVRVTAAHQQKSEGPLQVLVNIVPDNIFAAMSANTNMLQVIFFAILFGVAMVMAPANKVGGVKSFFEGANEVILKFVDMLMRFAPIGVFALLASLNIDIQLIGALGMYGLTVVLALAAMVFGVYPVLLRLLSRIKYPAFVRSILPAQVLAFCTSSSAATLPVTMDCARKNLGLSEEVTGFVLPLGATINMDGTSIHQGVSAVFIAQAFGIDLTLGQQLTILLTAVLSSIGAAAVPGAGIIMLIIVLEAVGLDPAGLALILAVDRPLDMLRTVVNVTGDTTVASIVARSEAAGS